MEQCFAYLVDPFGPDFGIPKLIFVCDSKYRILEPHCHRADERLPHVLVFESCFGKFIDCLEQSFPERAWVGASVTGVLAIQVRIDSLAEMALGVGEAKPKHARSVVKRRIQPLTAILAEFLHREIREPLPG